MSDTQKPVEETPAAPAAAAEPTPAAEPAVTSDEITSTETPAPAAEAVKAEEKKGDAEPTEPVAAGQLGYKAPGLVNAFRFSKKYFWFGKEPVKTDDLHSYLRGEKPDIAHPVAAWSHQTGEGLLYFAKSADQKEKPSGVINLAHVEEVYKDGVSDFYFKLHGHKHIFQCHANERDAWVDAFKSKIEEAKKMAKTITESQGYKDVYEKLGKSATAPVYAKTEETPKKSTDKAPEGVKKDNASGSDEESEKKKHSRSISRKRASIFSNLLGKREDAEAKKETKPEKEEVKVVEGEEAKPEEPVATEPAPGMLKRKSLLNITNPYEVATEAAKPDEPAPVAEGPSEPAAEQKDPPKPSKRGSIFGSILRKGGREVPKPVEEKEEAAPAVPAKDAEVVSASGPTEESASKPSEVTEETSAPVSNSPKKSGFLNYFREFKHSDRKEEPEVTPKADEPATAPAPEATPATETETTAPVEPAAESTEPTATAEPSKARRRSSFFTDLVGKVGKKPGEVTSDSEGEPKEKSSPLPKIVGGLFRGTSRAGKQKKGEAKKDTTPPTVEETPETAPAEETTPAAEPKSEETPTAPEPTQTNVVNGAIGDVVPDAITVGQTPQQVQAAA
ncbi:MAG: hypothetical protein M1840_006775 [Geoglossum simile]|nr:MAG: hypothetical protein M1840_006775 [Geoglossum simile]